MTHTLGPWTVRNGLSFLPEEHIRKVGEERLRNYWEIASGAGYLVDAVTGGFSFSSYALEDDVRLIVAAPDMLEALQVAQDEIGRAHV